MTITFQALIQGAIKRLYAEKQHIVSMATATGAAAGATLIDARLIDNRSDADTLKFVDAWVRIPAQTTPYWEQECIRQIGAYAPATGTLTPIDPFGFAYDGTGVQTNNTTLTDARRSWAVNAHAGNVVTCGGKTMTVTSNTATVLTGASWSGGGSPGNSVNYSITQIAPAATIYELHYELPPAGLKDCVNRSLRNLRRLTFAPITQVTDGGMEASGVASWAATNCTPTKLTAAASVMHGSQSLRVLNSAGNGYVASVAIPVIEGQKWLVGGFPRCNVGTGTLIPWDNTGGAAITVPTSEYTTDEGAWTELGGDGWITIPAGCESMSLRLRGTEAAADIYWDSVYALDSERLILDLPSWVTQQNQVKGLFSFPRGQEASGGGYEVKQNWRDEAYDWMPLVDEAAATPWQIQVPSISRPLFLYGERPWGELTLDADTTNADEDTVVAGALALAYELLGRAESKYWSDKWSFKKQQTQPEPSVRQTSRWVSIRARR